MTRVLDSQPKMTVSALVLSVHSGGGFRIITRDGMTVCDESPDTYARASQFSIDAGSLTGKMVAWIGGGFCIGPQVFAVAACKQTVYEFEPALEEFCPKGVMFVHGDWRETITGKYDVIVYDLGDPTPDLSAYLNPGGVVLP